VGKNLRDKFLDLLFPKYCVACGTWGEFVCQSCFKEITFVNLTTCPFCSILTSGVTCPAHKKYKLDGAVAAVYYGDVIKKAIAAWKYSQVKDLTDFLSSFLIFKLKEMDFIKEKPLIIPIPLHKQKLRKRGYNQSLLLAYRLADYFNLEVSECLERIINNPSQTSVGEKNRRQNVKGIFKIKKQPINKNILLIDDVITTGATLNEAAKILKENNNIQKIWAATIAR